MVKFLKNVKLLFMFFSGVFVVSVFEITKQEIILKHRSLAKISKLRPSQHTFLYGNILVKENHTKSALKLLEESGFPFIYDDWKTYINNFTADGEPVYKGSIVRGWPPEKDRYLPHYIRLK